MGIAFGNHMFVAHDKCNICDEDQNVIILFILKFQNMHKYRREPEWFLLRSVCIYSGLHLLLWIGAD